jgi:hypothetical protein
MHYFVLKYYEIEKILDNVNKSELKIIYLYIFGNYICISNGVKLILLYDLNNEIK